MKKCLKITLISKISGGNLRDSIQAVARKLAIEGTVQVNEPNELVIIACGEKENIDNFLDAVHEGFDAHVPEDVLVEPFLKEKDYRGIFRILE
jgi:acylphosphatase